MKWNRKEKIPRLSLTHTWTWPCPGCSTHIGCRWSWRYVSGWGGTPPSRSPVPLSSWSAIRPRWSVDTSTEMQRHGISWGETSFSVDYIPWLMTLDFLRRDQLLCWLPCLMTFSLYFCVEFPYQDTWDFLRKDQLLCGPSCLITFSSYIYVVSLPRYMGFLEERPTSLWTTLSGNTFSSYFYVEIPYQDTWDFLRKDQLLCGPRCLTTFSSYFYVEIPYQETLPPLWKPLFFFLFWLSPLYTPMFLRRLCVAAHAAG